MSETLIGPIQERWLQSLEQHPDERGIGLLAVKQSDGIVKCCVLGKLAVVAEIGVWEHGILKINGSRGSLKGVWQKLGLYGDFGHVRGDRTSNRKLSNLNDMGFTFGEIAAIIRADPKEYLSKAV